MNVLSARSASRRLRNAARCLLYSEPSTSYESQRVSKRITRRTRVSSSMAFDDRQFNEAFHDELSLHSMTRDFIIHNFTFQQYFEFEVNEQSVIAFVFSNMANIGQYGFGSGSHPGTPLVGQAPIPTAGVPLAGYCSARTPCRRKRLCLMHNSC